MAIAPTPKPAYPNVPVAPGVPAVARQAAKAQNAVAALVNDAQAVANLFQAPQWGIYTMGGQPVLGSSSTFAQFLNAVTTVPLATVASFFGIGGAGNTFTSSIGDFEFRQGYRIATAPQEQGAFTSYNKVQLPFDGRVTVLVGGTQAQRNAFLQTVAAMAASLTLFALVMPELVYPSINVVDFTFRRVAQRGVTLLAIDIQVEQVRVTGTAQYASTNTGSLSGADPVNVGQATPGQPTTMVPPIEQLQ